MDTQFNYHNFLRVTAICSWLGALTTALLIFLPNPEAETFEARILLHENSLYLTKLWILFAHPQLNFLAAIGVAFVLFKKYPGYITCGLLFLLFWAYTEVSQQSILIDTLNTYWRPGYLNATDETTRETFRTLITGSTALADSHYFVVIYGFGLGTLLYGLAFIRQTTWEKWIGYAMIFIGILSLLSFVRYYLGQSHLNNMVDGAYAWIYPYLQPAVRIALGIWLWQKAITITPNYQEK